MYIASMYIGFLFLEIFGGLSGGIFDHCINSLPAYAPGVAVVGVTMHPQNKIYQYV